VFLLGFIPSKHDQVVLLLCRAPCAHNTKKDTWDPLAWLPLIQDRAFLPWLVQVPDDQQTMTITPQLIVRLEDMWKNNNKATVDDLHDNIIDDNTLPVQLRFKQNNKAKIRRCLPVPKHIRTSGQDGS
jgi:regulator of nonsense transcripts 1